MSRCNSAVQRGKFSAWTGQIAYPPLVGTREADPGCGWSHMRAIAVLVSSCLSSFLVYPSPTELEVSQAFSSTNRPVVCCSQRKISLSTSALQLDSPSWTFHRLQFLVRVYKDHGKTTTHQIGRVWNIELQSSTSTFTVLGHWSCSEFLVVPYEADFGVKKTARHQCVSTLRNETEQLSTYRAGLVGHRRLNSERFHR